MSSKRRPPGRLGRNWPKSECLLQSVQCRQADFRWRNCRWQTAVGAGILPTSCYVPGCHPHGEVHIDDIAPFA